MDQNCPLFSTAIAAGFPSPADDCVEQHLDLNKKLIKHPAATFFVKVEGDSMQNAGIYSGDTLIVDRSLSACDGSVIVAILNGEFTVKKLSIQKNGIFLIPENHRYQPIDVSHNQDFQVWGVVTYVLHRLA